MRMFLISVKAAIFCKGLFYSQDCLYYCVTGSRKASVSLWEYLYLRECSHQRHPHSLRPGWLLPVCPLAGKLSDLLFSCTMSGCKKISCNENNVRKLVKIFMIHREGSTPPCPSPHTPHCSINTASSLTRFAF